MGLLDNLDKKKEAAPLQDTLTAVEPDTPAPSTYVTEPKEASMQMVACTVVYNLDMIIQKLQTAVSLARELNSELNQ